MTESEWLAGTDTASMLECIRGKTSNRKLRLFACAVWRTRPAFRRGDAHSVLALEIAEQVADGLLLPAERPRTTEGSDYLVLEPDAAEAARELCSITREMQVPEAALLREIVGDPFRPLPALYDVAPAPGSDWPVALTPLGWQWLAPTALAIAQAAYADRDWGALPVLADAMEEAGCVGECPACGGQGGVGQEHPFGDTFVTEWLTCPDCEGAKMVSHPLLAHLRRRPGCPRTDDYGRHVGMVDPTDCPSCSNEPDMDWPCPHVRGCWALDLVLGRE